MLVPRAMPKLGEDSQRSPVDPLGLSQPVGVAEQQGQVVEADPLKQLFNSIVVCHVTAALLE
jgi:hypothetical protein